MGWADSCCCWLQRNHKRGQNPLNWTDQHDCNHNKTATFKTDPLHLEVLPSSTFPKARSNWISHQRIGADRTPDMIFSASSKFVKKMFVQIFLQTVLFEANYCQHIDRNRVEFICKLEWSNVKKQSIFFNRPHMLSLFSMSNITVTIFLTLSKLVLKCKAFKF